MDAVPLVEGLVARHPLQQKRHERDAVFRRERRIDLVKGDDVVAAVVRRRFHAGEDHRDAARLRPLDDLREVALQLLGRQTAQAVVAAERDDQDADVAVERPVEPRQSAGRRIAGDAGVHDLEVEPCRVEALLQQRRIRRGLGDAEAGGQAVAEHGDARARAGRRRGAAGAGAAVAAGARRWRRSVDVAGTTSSIVAARRAAGDASARAPPRPRFSSACMLRRELPFQGFDRGGEHALVRRRPRGREIGPCARERELDRLAPGLRVALLGRQRAAELLRRVRSPPAEIDVLALEASRHDRLQYSTEMQSAHELMTRWPALDVAAKRARLNNSLHLSPGLADAVAGSIAAAERAAAACGERDRRRGAATRPCRRRSPTGSAG